MRLQDEFCRECLLVLFFWGALRRLVDAGAVVVGQAPDVLIGPADLARFDQLEAEGFRPGWDELALLLTGLRLGGNFRVSGTLAVELLEMLSHWDLCRDRLAREDAAAGLALPKE